MFGTLRHVVSFLLASSVQQQQPHQPQQQQQPHHPQPQPQQQQQQQQQPIRQDVPPSSLKEIRSSMDQMYEDLLDRPGAVTKRLSPTLQFAYVSPPVNGISTWRLSQQQSPSQSQSQDDEAVVSQNNNNNNNIQEEEKDNNQENDNEKPIAIYLPGLDGTGISAFSHQFDDMATAFELWRLVIDTDDRSEFRELLASVVGFVEALPLHNNRKVVLVGESFGGVLAAAVALQLQKKQESSQPTTTENPLQGLVLVNPATAFHETNWDTIVPLLASLQYLSGTTTQDGSTTTTTTKKRQPTPYSLTGGLALSYLMPDGNQMGRIGELVMNVMTSTMEGGSSPSALVEDMWSLLEILEERLPADTLNHRVGRWLSVGTSLVNQRLPHLQLDTLVIYGDQDRIMPSAKEAERLARVIPSCETLLVKGRGHLVLDENVNLTEAILYSNMDPLGYKQNKKYDPILDWSLPSAKEVDDVIESTVSQLRTIHSPLFFSTDSKGKRWRGLNQVPKTGNGPILFVANHQFFGLDLNLIVAELLQDKNLICRGLAHPIVFNNTKISELNGRTPGLLSSVASKGPAGAAGLNSLSNFQKFGAVPVTPRNYYRLMQSGQNAILFPGGVKDVFCTDPSYPLLWPEDNDFVRTAARFNATIVPLSAVGMLDSARVLVQADDLVKVPFLGKQIQNAGGFPPARFDAAEGETDPLPPIPFPAMPKRNYFVFGKPFSTTRLDPKNKEACAKIYKEVVAETRRGLDDLLEARKEDPFYDTPRRVAYEQLTGKKAPTFGMERLNRKFL